MRYFRRRRHADRRRARRRHAHRLHGRPRLRAVGRHGRRPRHVGPPVRGRARLRPAAGRHQRPRRLARRGRPDPDRGRLHQRAARPHARSLLLARSSSASGGSSTSTRATSWAAGAAGGAGSRRPGAAARRPRARLGRHRGDVRASTDWRPRSRRWCTGPRCRSTSEGRQVGRATSICWGPTIKKMVGFGSVDPTQEPGTTVSVEWSVEGERGKVGRHRRADAVPGPAAQARVGPLRRSGAPSSRRDRIGEPVRDPSFAAYIATSA